jgi:hypothetical protein
MKNKKAISFICIIFSAFIWVPFSGCAGFQKQYHQYTMRGQIIEIVDKGIILCIGSKDGAQVGDEFIVYKIVKATPGFTRHYQKLQTGTVKITEIIDEHFAKAAIISGTVDMHSIVELPFTLKELQK